MLVLISGTAGLAVASAPAASAAGPAVVTLGFDDERASQTNAFAGLQAQGLKGTFYVISRQIQTGNDPESLALAQLKAIKAAGHEISGHTRAHPDLTTLPQAQMTAENLRWPDGPDKRWSRITREFRLSIRGIQCHDGGGGKIMRVQQRSHSRGRSGDRSTG